ncbi:hypothetical protein MMC22_006572 [Lobaria immixta]|nr:hypothetical protein [Lobaria immixta]
MPQPRIVPISRRSRQVLTPDIWAPPPSDAELAVQVKRVNARLAQRAVAKASASNVAAKRQEVPRVPRVARQPRQHAPTLESKESSLKVIVAPMAPRATRFRAVDASPLAFSLPPTPKVALKSILRGSASQQKRGERKKVSFGHVETVEVQKWIGIVQVCCPFLHRLAILTNTSIRALSPTISCSTRAQGARGDTFMSTLILAGFLPVTSSGGHAKELKATGSTPTFMASHYPGGPTGTARTADAIVAISIDDHDNRRHFRQSITSI